MDEKREYVIYFTNGRMARFKLADLIIVNPDERVEVNAEKDTATMIGNGFVRTEVIGGRSLINWSNVAFIRRWVPAEEE